MKKLKIVDLSLPIHEAMAVYPGDPRVKIESLVSNTKELELVIRTHHGTHVDAPLHRKIEKSLDEYGLDKFVNPAVKIDLTPKADTTRKGVKYLQAVKREHLEPYKNIIGQKEAVVIRTGYGELIQKGLVEKDNISYLTEDAGQFLAGFENLNVVGIDSLTIDKPKSGGKVHNMLLKKDIILLETLVNLESAPEEFTLWCLPLAIKNSDGSPCRAVAVYESG